MARPRETDSRKHPEQAERFRRAMWWARIASASELTERMRGKLKQTTINNRIQGNIEMKPIEIEPFAHALGVSPAVLTPGGPMLPDPDDETHLHAIVTGTPGSWTLTVVRPGENPQAIRYQSEEPPTPFPPASGSADESSDQDTEARGRNLRKTSAARSVSPGSRQQQRKGGQR